MADFHSIAIIFVYLAILIFGTHFIRTWAFNRHEAITFESSSITALLALLMLWQYGFDARLLIFFVALLIMFTVNAFTQWHFYMVLQDIIEKAFSKRAEYLKKKGFDTSVTQTLRTMASVAIMPSFSRFIEESRVFNNPGSFIGLIKSIMKRQRFQKKKYLMRECFAENINLIGPCKPEIDDMMRDEEHVVPGAVHPNDLALGYKDEKIGLFTYDILGMGAHVAVFFVLLYLYHHPITGLAYTVPTLVRTLLMMLSAVLFTYITHILRHFGFARYETISYEFSFTALVIASFRAYHVLIGQDDPAPYKYWILLAYFIAFLLLSYNNKRLDKKLHKSINEKYSKLIYIIPLETETDRTKRRFLNNLKIISEWTLVPFPGREKKSLLLNLLCKNDKMKKFEEINREKLSMPAKTEKLIDKIVPEHRSVVNESNLRLDEEDIKKAQFINYFVSFSSFAALFLLIGLGLL